LREIGAKPPGGNRKQLNHALRRVAPRSRDELTDESLPFRKQQVCFWRMTRLLDLAVDGVRSLSSDVQDELARMLLQVAGGSNPSFS
jgi:hypothetical protein